MSVCDWAGKLIRCQANRSMVTQLKFDHSLDISNAVMRVLLQNPKKALGTEYPELDIASSGVAVCAWFVSIIWIMVSMFTYVIHE